MPSEQVKEQRVFKAGWWAGQLALCNSLHALLGKAHSFGDIQDYLMAVEGSIEARGGRDSLADHIAQIMREPCRPFDADELN